MPPSPAQPTRPSSSISSNANLSQHPIDQLIRELIRTGRAATEEEVELIRERMAKAPFNPQIVRVPDPLRDIPYRGRRLGARANSLAVHLVQGVVVSEQWAAGTTERQYLHDLRRAVRDPMARLAVYDRRGGPIAGVFAPNTVPTARRGPSPLPWMYVVYSADRGTIISAYQASSLQHVSIPKGVRWLS